jgi:menaquinone-dependent protoporphyrinogen oxidase
MRFSASEHATNRGRGAVLVCYATHDGHSRVVAARIAARVAANGIPASAHDLAAGPPAPDELSGAPAVVLVASVRYGRHLPAAVGFLAAYATLASPPPLALASVNLTARKPEKGTAETNPYLRKLIACSPCKPGIAIAVAGKLDYPRYRWFDRILIQGIMWLTGGPTDPSTCVVYTAWDAVDAFAAKLAELAARTDPWAVPAAVHERF